MSIHALSKLNVTPVRVEAPPVPCVAVVIVTWNRKRFVSSVLEALSKQTFPVGQLHVVVVDNCSTDETLEHLAERYRPEAIVENPTKLAHAPQFAAPVSQTPGLENTLRFGSLTIVHNHANHGGCGGFNTGFAYVSLALDRPDSPGGAPDYVWLVDDDIDLPTDTCAQLVRAAEEDQTIGLVGSRTMDLGDRGNTIETTIYFDAKTGRMSDEPTPEHRLHESHQRWVKQVGGTRGRNEYHGLRDVDVVSACSLLARWSLVREVGFWDYRYFIYCDDADWCLRFARAGHRVVLNLDAVVFHTPWHHKLTPSRAYYAQRNIFWVIQKILPVEHLRRSTLTWMRSVLRHSLVAGLNRRIFQAEIQRRSCDDVMTGRWGKLDPAEPALEEIGAGLDTNGLLRAGATIALTLNRGDSVVAAADFRERVRAYLKSVSREGDEPRWVEIVRNDVPGAESERPTGVARRVVYAGRFLSRMKRQKSFVFDRPDALVVFDQGNDFPLLRARFNVHVDHRQAGKCQIERGETGRVVKFLARWVWTAARAVVYSRRLGPYVSPSMYG